MNNKLKDSFAIRAALPSDHPKIIEVMTDWWSGRDLTRMLPRLFLEHFCDTSIIVEESSRLVAFLVGFLSQSNPKEGYIHFAGVHPEHRACGVGRRMYECFSEICNSNNRTIIRSCTSPVNKSSIRFHEKIGFQIEKGNSEIDGIHVTLDYNKPDDPKVRFIKHI